MVTLGQTLGLYAVLMGLWPESALPFSFIATYRMVMLACDRSWLNRRINLKALEWVLRLCQMQLKKVVRCYRRNGSDEATRVLRLPIGRAQSDDVDDVDDIAFIEAFPSRL